VIGGMICHSETEPDQPVKDRAQAEAWEEAAAEAVGGAVLTDFVYARAAEPKCPTNREFHAPL